MHVYAVEHRRCAGGRAREWRPQAVAARPTSHACLERSSVPHLFRSTTWQSAAAARTRTSTTRRFKCTLKRRRLTASCGAVRCLRASSSAIPKDSTSAFCVPIADCGAVPRMDATSPRGRDARRQMQQLGLIIGCQCGQEATLVTARATLVAARQQHRNAAPSNVPGTLQDCVYQQARLAAWYQSLREAPTRALAACAAEQTPWPEHSLSGSCETGMPDPVRKPFLFRETFAWARRTVASADGSYIVISLATSDSPCSVTRSIASLTANTSRSLIVLHAGCNSPNTPENRSLFATMSFARVLVNPDCVPAARAHGSVLHAHLLNIGLVARLVSAVLLPRP
jgi:hypothetical protein